MIARAIGSSLQGKGSDGSRNPRTATAAPPPPPPAAGAAYPVHIDADRADHYNRFLPLIKWLLALPHYLVLIVLGIGALFVILISFFAVLITGRYPRGLWDYIVGVHRWGWRVFAYVYLLTDQYPPFTLEHDPAYPARLEVDYPEEVNRWRPLVHWLLIIPYAIVAYLLVYVAFFVAFIAVFVILFTAKLPEGLFKLIRNPYQWSVRSSSTALASPLPAWTGRSAIAVASGDRSLRAARVARSLPTRLSPLGDYSPRTLITSRLRSAAVELAVEDRLPRAEVEPALGHRHDHLVVDEQVLQMGVAVVLAAAVVAVVAGIGRELAGDVVGRLLPRRRRELVEPLERVLLDPGLVVVDPDPGGDVHRRDQRHALADRRTRRRRPAPRR